MEKIRIIIGQEGKVTKRKMGASFLFPNSHTLLDGSAQVFLTHFVSVCPVRGP